MGTIATFAASQKTERSRLSHSRRRSPLASFHGTPLRWTLLPGACPTIKSRAVTATWRTGRGPNGNSPSQIRQPRTPRNKRVKDIQQTPGNGLQCRVNGGFLFISDIEPYGSRATALLQTFSTVKPYSRITTSPGAEAPKRSTPSTSPRIAVEPLGIGRIVFEEPGPQHIRHRCGAHRHSRVTAVGLLHGVHGEEAQRVDARVIQFGIRSHRRRRCIHSNSP